MQRDGALTSLWQSTPGYTSAEFNFPDQTFDVAVVGAGITGLSTALRLQEAGKKVVVVEAHTIGFGTTGGTTAHINTIFDNPYHQIISDFGEKNAQLLAMASKQAIQLIESNITEHNIDCDFVRLPGYIYSVDGEQSKLLDQMIEATKRAGVDMNYTDNIPVPIPFETAAVVPGQAQFNPAKYIYGLATAFEEAGGIIVQNARVNELREIEEFKILETAKGKIKSKIIIYATHIPPGVNLLHFRCAPYRSYAIAVKLANNNYPEALAYDLYDPYHYYRTQYVNGEPYLIVGGEDHKTAHKDNTTDNFRKLEAYVRRFYNIQRVAFQWSSQFYEPVDGLAYIGQLPQHDENCYVATGFGGNGMTYGTISAIVLTDLILDGNSTYKSLFDPLRIKPVAGFTQFVKENADVVGNLIGGWFSKEKLNEIVDLAAGEAKVVRYEGKAIALFKDEYGKLHAVNPTCTHVKCTVNWNDAERSWDCPCHGARYDAHGKVLTGPASKDLTPIEIKDLLK
jgi:glycine/D-amino acid oxidase-like deaminating enzyme/nitrite reductase/ring-hydroxylating ferredoxin subunit